MDRANDVSSLEDGKGLGLNPVNDSDAIIRELLAKDVGEDAFRRIDGVSALLLELPQHLNPLLLGVLVETINDGLEGFRHLKGLRLRDLDQSSHVDEDRVSVGEPFGQLRIGLVEGSVGSNHRSAGDDVGRHLERIVQLGKAADQDLDALGAVVNQVGRSSDDAVGVQKRFKGIWCHCTGYENPEKGLGGIVSLMSSLARTSRSLMSLTLETSRVRRREAARRLRMS